MMLWAPEIAVVPVTIHMPFKDVPQHLTRDLIFETGRVVARDLIDRFGIARPRSRSRGSIRTPAKTARSQGGQPDRQARGRASHRRRHRRAGTAFRRHMFHDAARKTYDVASACITTRR